PRRSGCSRAPSLRPVEVFVLVGERKCRELSPLLGRELFGLLDPRDEPPARLPEGELRVDIQTSRDVNGSEENVAELLEGAQVRLALGRRVRLLRDRFTQLAQLV